MSRDEIDGVALALAKLTEALLDQIQRATRAEIGERAAWSRTGAMEKRYTSLVTRLQVQYDDAMKYDPDDSVMGHHVKQLLAELKEEED